MRVQLLLLPVIGALFGCFGWELMKLPHTQAVGTVFSITRRWRFVLSAILLPRIGQD
jgi:hypothetical protein